MAKLPATVATLPSKKQKVRSEIDDIFSTASTSAVPTPSVLSKNTKKKRQLVPESKLDTAAVETGGEKPQKKRKGPETIIDSSAVIESFRNHPVPTSNNPTSGKSGKEGGTATKEDEEEERFMDSRGTARRKTEDGYPIYDQIELKIGLGQDTELCPFDCQCCF